MKKIYALVILSIFILEGCQTESKTTSRYQDPKYKEGQQWDYQTRKGEENSYLTILKVEQYDDKEVIIHIAVEEAKMKNPNLANGYSNRIAHLPFSRQALEKSGLKLKKESEAIPHFSEGYQQWKQAFNAGKAGFFTTTVAEAVEFVEQEMKKKE